MITASATVLVFLVVAWVFVLGVIAVGKLVRRSPPEGRPRAEPFADDPVAREPGELNFDPRFFVAALVFLIFDVAIAFLYPVAVVFKRLVAAGHGARAFGEVFTFVGVLFLGLAYLLKKGDLDWIRGPDGKR
jgi:NADH-quinone oxidoreductase subunit A